MKYIFIAILSLSLNAQNKNETYRFSKDIASDIEKDTLSWKHQIGATNYSISGYYKKALETWDKNGARIVKATKEDSLYFNSFKPQNAKDYIINRSKKEKIIILNEAHHNASHRVFTTSLLQELYDNGYRFFGLEAVSDTLINQRKFVTKDSGYYTSEPQMANLINEALKIGFTVFNYESSENKNGKEREIEQAENIAEMMRKNPDAKFLIHCGWDHVIEGTPADKNWEKAMAGRLKEITQIDPFTIDQTFYSEKGDAKFNKPYIGWVNLDYPVIMVQENGKTFNGRPDNDQTDCRIIHPVTKYINDKPDWITLYGERVTYKIPKKRIPQFPVLVLAYNLGEYEKNGIPVDITEILDEKQIGNLILKKGQYTIIIKDMKYRVIAQYQEKIK